MCFLKARKCLKTNLSVYIYRRGVQTSETSIFTKKKALDLSIAISELWKITKIDGLSKNVFNKLQDDTFVTFSILMYAIVYNIDNSKDRLFIINNLKQHIPDLQFRNGVKQKMNNFFRTNSTPKNRQPDIKLWRKKPENRFQILSKERK